MDQLPPTVRPLLADYRARLERELPGLLVGLYVHGSIALGAFDPQFSDVDFLAIISRRCTPDDLQHLANIHQQLRQDYPHPLLEGAYLLGHDLGKFEDAIPPSPGIHDGQFNPAGQHDVNAVTWWVLKHQGLALVGPEPADLDFSVDWDMLMDRMRTNLNTYWVRFARDPQRILGLWSDGGIQWAVLGVLRQFYSFRESAITSKVGAGAYALQHLPPQWHRLIQEALNIRTHQGPGLYRLRLTRLLEAVRFMRYIIQTCNSYFA